MSTPILYKYDEFRFFTGTQAAQEHPRQQGVYLTYILGATELPLPGKPDALPEWQRYQLGKTGKKWLVRADNRGREGFLKDGTWVKITTPELPKNWFGDERPEPSLTIEEAVEAKLAEIGQGQAEAMASLKAGYTKDEREGWPFKLAEAELLMGSPDAEVPMLEAEFKARGRKGTLQDFARKVLEKNKEFKILSGHVNGQQSQFNAKLEAAALKKSATPKKIMAMKFEYSLPEDK